MSDEFGYEYDSEGWPSGEEGNAEEEDEGKIMIENTFHEAEDNKKNNPKDSLEQFENVVLLEEQQGEEVVWRFKALENIVVISGHLQEFENMVTKHKALLKLINKVARNDVTDAINNILECVSTLKDPKIQKEMYENTLQVLKSNNERLWFSISLKLGKIYLDNGSYETLDALIKDLKDSSRLPDGEFDMQKGNVLEVFALEIQMCTATKASQRLKTLYPQTVNMSTVINDPRVMGIIKESGGKMFLSEKNWEKALEELFEAFKSYQESGNPRAKPVLKYVVLASILADSDINYCDTREAKVYKDDPEIVAIMNLRTAYEQNDIAQIQNILQDKKSNILTDPLITTYLDDLLRNIRLSIIIAKIKPYKTVSLKFLAGELNITVDQIMSLLVELILEQRIQGKIDQLNGFLELTSESKDKVLNKKHLALQKWANTLLSLHTSLTEKVTF